MRGVVWNRDNEEEYDDLSTVAPTAPKVREPLPEPPLPSNSKWRHAPRPIAPSSKFLTAELFMVGCFIALACLVGAGYSNQGERRLDLTIGYITLGAIAITCAYFAFKLWTEGSIAHQEIRWLARDIGIDDCYPVHIQIHQNGHISGTDEGIVYFDQDALHYHGIRCDLKIGAQDLKFDPHMIWTSHGWAERGFVRPYLALRHPEIELMVTFTTYAKMSKRDPRDCAYRFRHDMRQLLHHWRPSQVTSVYPPMEPQPTDIEFKQAKKAKEQSTANR